MIQGGTSAREVDIPPVGTATVMGFAEMASLPWTKLVMGRGEDAMRLLEWKNAVRSCDTTFPLIGFEGTPTQFGAFL